MIIKDNEKFYEKLDANRITLSREITSFIDKRIYYIPYKYSIVMKFYCQPMNDEEKKRIVNMLRSNYGLEANEKNHELKINNYKSLTLFFMGIFFLALSSVTAEYGFLLAEVFSIAGWVSIWESISSVLFNTIRIKLDKYDTTNLYNSEVIFISEKEK
jgi:hypothetical protein